MVPDRYPLTPKLSISRVLTGLWQVTQRGTGEVSPDERIALDNTYATRHGLGFDLRLILKTVPALFQSENV